MKFFDRCFCWAARAVSLFFGLFFAASALVVFAFSAKWLLLNTPKLAIPVIVFGVLFLGAAVGFFLRFVLRRLDRWGQLKTVLFICGAAFLLRILTGLILSALDYVMVSDYLYAHQAASGAINAIPAVPFDDYFLQRGAYIHFVNAAYWGHHIALMHVLTRVFGNAMFLNDLLNAIADTCVVWLIMAVGEKMFRSRRTGVAAAVIYALFPTSIICCNWFSGEFLGIALLFGGTWCMLAVLTPWCGALPRNPAKCILLAMIAGLLLGASDMMKPVAILIFMSLFAFEVCGLFGSFPRSRVQWKAVLTNVVLIVLAACVTMISTAGLKKSYKHYTGYSENPSGVSGALFVGLNPEYRGMYHKDLSEMAIQLAQDFRGDPVKINAVYRDALMKNMRRSWKKLPKMFVQKAVLIFGSESWAVDRIAGGLKESHPGFRQSVIGKLGYQWGNLYYGVILCGVIAAFFFMLVRKRLSSEGILICLFIILGTCMQMVVEAQPRYRISFLNPFMVMAAAYGLRLLRRIVAYRISKRRSHRDVGHTPSV